MKTIVLGYDESAEASRALEKTAELAKALSAQVLVTSFAPVMSFTGRGVGPYDPTDPPERHSALARDAATTLAKRGVTAQAIAGVGEPGEAIVEVAGHHDADLIVIGMSQHHRFTGLFGSVSEHVAHHAQCDVLLVH